MKLVIVIMSESEAGLLQAGIFIKPKAISFISLRYIQDDNFS